MMALNNADFDFYQCNFGKKNMSRKDASGNSKEGSGRVGLFRAS